MSLWCVVGGAASGGIMVRQGQDTSSAQESERLSTGAVVWELEFASASSRLRYEKISGTGPASGWVSTKLKSNDLLIKGILWEVVGGGAAGGIVVREGEAVSSAEASERLGTGSIIKELACVGDRLHFERLVGSGPKSGWVSLKFRSNDLVSKISKDWEATAAGVQSNSSSVILPPTAIVSDPSTKGAQAEGPEFPMANEENGFSYEGLPSWVPWVAAVARDRRKGLPYLPKIEPQLARLAKCKELPPFKKITPKKVREMLALNLPGDIFGLPFPRTREQMLSDEFGHEFLTRAFHVAGTLPEDNRVTKIVRCDELPIKGFDTAGGAAMKAFLTIEYLKADPALETELLMKYTYDPARNIEGVSQYGADDGPEVVVSCKLQHLFPFRTPKFYYGDVSRESTAFLIIMEKIPFGKRGAETKPYEILPPCGKFQDFLLPRPEEYYCSIFRAMGQLAAWDQLGRFDEYLGAKQQFAVEEYLATKKREPKPKSLIAGMQDVVGKGLDQGIELITKYAMNLVAEEARDVRNLERLKAELMEMSPYFNDMADFYQNNSSDYISAAHANLQADNAWFWRDEYGDLACGVLDWGSFSRGPFILRFLGCLSGMDPHTLVAHEEGIIKAFVDEYSRCGGPQLLVEDVLLRFHLAYIPMLLDSIGWLNKQVYKETPKEEFLNFKSVEDEVFQSRFYTRCGSLMVLNSFSVYLISGKYKSYFDSWANGVGKAYLSKYE